MIRGALVLLGGMRVLLVEPELREILWRVLAVLLVLMLVISSATFWLIDVVIAMWIPAGDSWYWQALSWLAGLLAFVLAVLCGMVGFVMFGSAVSAFWLNDLAARTERIYGKEVAVTASGWIKPVLQSLSNSIRPLFELMPWGVAALLCFWLPPLATALWTYGTARFLSFELIDPTASRRSWDFRMRKQCINDQRWFYLGFSGLAMLLLMIPFLNLLVIPAAVVGHSRYLSLRKT